MLRWLGEFPAARKRSGTRFTSPAAIFREEKMPSQYA